MDNAGARRAAPTREEREHERARWERQEQERLARFEDAERARAQQQQADLDERYRKIRKAEADRRAKWVAERDRITAELAAARNAVSLPRAAACRAAEHGRDRLAAERRAPDFVGRSPL
jgi:flagellar motility protein MotE (MotC chaperone)